MEQIEEELREILDIFGENEVVVEPEPIFPEPVIPPMPQSLVDTGIEKPAPSITQEMIPETKEDVVSDIIKDMQESRSAYIEQVPKWSDIEDFLDSLTVEEASNIRKQLKSRSIYGNAPLEQLFMLQYGVLMRARSYADMMERIDNHYHTRLSKTLGVELDTRMEQHIKKLEKLSSRITRDIERAETEAAEANKQRSAAYTKELELKGLDISKVDAEFKKMVEHHNLTLRNNIFAPIKAEQRKAQENLLSAVTKLLNEQRESLKVRFFITVTGVAMGGGLLMLGWAAMKHYGLV